MSEDPMDRRTADPIKPKTTGINIVWHVFLTFGGWVFIGACALVGAWILKDIRSEAHTNTQQLELLNKNVISQNQQTLLLKTIDERMKIPVEEKVKLANTIYTLGLVKKVPFSLICAVIEQESNWDAAAHNDSGATGLMQLIPRYAFPYMRAERIPDEPNGLFDASVNALIGISQLADHQRGWVLAGKTKPTDWLLTLHSYAWGKANTDILVSGKIQKVDVPNLTYSLQVLERQKNYQKLGLE
jgi:flagellar biogenesis protein FliO